MLENRNSADLMGSKARIWTLNLMNPEKLINEQRLIFSELI